VTRKNLKNLKPIKSIARARELGRKGGLVRSENKRIAARLRELKKKGLTDENSKRIYDVITDSDMSALDIQMFLIGLKADVESTDQKIKLANALINLHKAHHGTKQKVEMNTKNLWLDFNEAYEKYKEES
jgi:hypothetical protein